MIVLKLFLSFLKIGSFAFGGGYAMLSFMRDECLSHGWLTMEEILNFVAVAESTPGPIAVNMATFIGSSQAGFIGALISTIAVVFTAFVIMVIIAKNLKNILKYPVVRRALNCIQPVVVGLIIATATSFLLNCGFGIKTIHSEFSFNWKGFVILGILFAVTLTHKKLRKKTFSPILLIIISGILGFLFFGF